MKWEGKAEGQGMAALNQTHSQVFSWSWLERLGRGRESSLEVVCHKQSSSRDTKIGEALVEIQCQMSSNKARTLYLA